MGKQNKTTYELWVQIINTMYTKYINKLQQTNLVPMSVTHVYHKRRKALGQDQYQIRVV